VDLFDVARACARRWYVFLPLLLLTTWFTYSTYNGVKPVYYTQAVVGLTPQNVRNYGQPGPLPVNGLLESGGPGLIANMSLFGFRDPEVIQKVIAGGGSADYKVKMFPGPGNAPPLPLLTIDTTQPDSDTAARTMELVVAQADQIVKNVQRQAGVSESQLVGTVVVSRPGRPVSGTPSRVRSAVSIFAGGLGLSVLASVIADVVLSRREGRRRGLVPPHSATRAGAAYVGTDEAFTDASDSVVYESAGEVVSNRR
jgi:hypothetical protein